MGFTTLPELGEGQRSLPAMPRQGPAPDVGVRDFGRSSEMNGEGCGM